MRLSLNWRVLAAREALTDQIPAEEFEGVPLENSSKIDDVSLYSLHLLLRRRRLRSFLERRELREEKLRWEQ